MVKIVATAVVTLIDVSALASKVVAINSPGHDHRLVAKLVKIVAMAVLLLVMSAVASKVAAAC